MCSGQKKKKKKDACKNKKKHDLLGFEPPTQQHFDERATTELPFVKTRPVKWADIFQNLMKFCLKWRQIVNRSIFGFYTKRQNILPVLQVALGRLLFGGIRTPGLVITRLNL